MSVASVAPARQSRTNVGLFRSSQMELGGGGREETEGQSGPEPGCEEAIVPEARPFPRPALSPVRFCEGRSGLPVSWEAPTFIPRS